MDELIWLVPVGILAALIGRWRAALFLGVPLAAYLFVISVQTELFAFRYVFPVFFVLLWFIAYGCSRWCGCWWIVCPFCG